MSEIIWEDPPAEAMQHKPKVGSIGAWLVDIRKKPNTWARLPREYANLESARAAASGIRNGTTKGTVKGEFEAIAYDNMIWARYTAKNHGDPNDDDGSADDDERRAYPAKVRAWAKLTGVEITSRGRIPANVVKLYEDATGDMRPERALSAVQE